MEKWWIDNQHFTYKNCYLKGKRNAPLVPILQMLYPKPILKRDFKQM